MRRAGTFLVVFALSVGLAACGGGADGGMEQDTASMEDTAVASGMQQETSAMGTSVTLTARNQSGITGTATIRSSGDSVGIEVTFQGLTEGEAYPVHLHTGSCSAGGGVAAPIGEATGGADGTGTASGSVALSALSADETYFVQGHLPGGQPAVCGDAPAVSELTGGSSGGGADGGGA